MRILRFRAYDKFQNDIFDVMEIDFVGQKVKTRYMGRFCNWLEMNDVILLQFTGLSLDGVPVFEGDMLTIGDQKYHVEYNQEACAYHAVNVDAPKDTYSLHQMLKNDSCCVVGNYYTSSQKLRA